MLLHSCQSPTTTMNSYVGARRKKVASYSKIPDVSDQEELTHPSQLPVSPQYFFLAYFN